MLLSVNARPKWSDFLSFPAVDATGWHRSHDCWSTHRVTMDPNIHEAHRRDRRYRRLPAMIVLALIAIVGGAWLGLFGFLAGNSALGTVEDFEDRYVCDVGALDLSLPAVSSLSEVFTHDGVLLGKLSERNSQPAAIDEIPEVVVGALLSAEDKGFYEHRGVNFVAIARAASSRTGGASTITQQVVKQNFLSADRTLERKICEALVATELEEIYTKDQILEFYINSVYFGSNAYGIRAAAQEYFGRSLDELTAAQAATIVTIIRNPTFYHPRKNPAESLIARNRTLDQMELNGYVDAAAVEKAKDEPLMVIPHQVREELAPQVMLAVRQELLRSDEYGLGTTVEERKRAVFGCPAADTTCEGGGGLDIEVTIDYELQTEANRILRAWFRPGLEGPTGAIAMVDNESAAVRVISSGVDFGSDIEAGERPYDIAQNGARAAGSAFKPFTLAAALETGDTEGNRVTLNSFWNRASPVEIDCGFPCTPDGDVWTVQNASGDAENRLQTLESATYNSVNSVYARVVDAIGADKVLDMSRRLGITSDHLKPYPSITLGAFGVSPLEMAASYSTFANYGVQSDPYLIERITDADGNVIYEHDSEPTPVLTRSISASIVNTLEQVVTSGTGTRADIGRPQAGKTGTANESVDVWYVGFVPQLTTAVWVGNPDHPEPLEDVIVWNDLEGREETIPRAYGGNLAAPIWKQFMLEATKGLPALDFPDDPPGMERYYVVPDTVVPDLSGLGKNEMENVLYEAHLNIEYSEIPSFAPKGAILAIDPEAEEVVPHGSAVIITVSSGVPPTVPVPDLIGLPSNEVAGVMSGSRLEWSFDEAPVDDPEKWGYVVSTSPGPGAQLKPGSNVVVFIGVEPPPPLEEPPPEGESPPEGGEPPPDG